MSSEPTRDFGPSDGCDEGVALVHRAQDSGEWQPVVDWLVRHPQFAEEIGKYLGGDRQLEHFVHPSLPSTRIGPSIDGYELREILGTGGMGVVYRGYDSTLKRDVAVKLVRNEHAISATELARLRFEGEVVASLDHANIVPILASGESQGFPYLVMPLMAGGNLASRIRASDEGRYPVQGAARLVREIALGVEHAHRRGLIHRDLKPANVLLDGDGIPRIADFGLARRLDATASSSAGIAGTVAYMAPEQARGERGLTTAVDVHALGVILFELLTGSTPYGTGDPTTVLRRVTEMPPPEMKEFRPDVPDDLESICRKCLEKKPGDRYASAQELADDLGRFLRHESVHARPRGLLSELGAAVSRPADVQPFVTLASVVFSVVYLPLTHLTIFVLYLAGAPSVWGFAVMMVHIGLWAIQIWWFHIRRRRALNPIEHIGTTAHIATWLGVMSFLPLSVTYFGCDAMPLYPVLNAVAAAGFFHTGNAYAGRQYFLGLLGFSQNLLLPFLPFWAWPLLHSVVGLAMFGLFGVHLRRIHLAARSDRGAVEG